MRSLIFTVYRTKATKLSDYRIFNMEELLTARDMLDVVIKYKQTDLDDQRRRNGAFISTPKDKQDGG